MLFYINAGKANSTNEKNKTKHRHHHCHHAHPHRQHYLETGLNLKLGRGRATSDVYEGATTKYSRYAKAHDNHFCNVCLALGPAHWVYYICSMTLRPG